MVTPSLGVGRGLADLSTHRARGELGGRQCVVDAPAAVSVEAATAPGPPGVGPWPVAPEGTAEVCPAQVGGPGVEIGTLPLEEAGLAAVAPPVLDVDLVVRDVEITTHDHLATRARTPEVGETSLHGVEEAVFLRLSGLVSGLAGVDVDAHHGQRPDSGVDVDLHPATGISELLRPDARAHGAMRRGGEHRDTRPPLGGGLGVCDVEVPKTGLVEHLSELFVVGSHLLKTDDLSTGSREPREPTPSRCRTNPVDVGSDNLHHRHRLSHTARVTGASEHEQARSRSLTPVTRGWCGWGWCGWVRPWPWRGWRRWRRGTPRS